MHIPLSSEDGRRFLLREISLGNVTGDEQHVDFDMGTAENSSAFDLGFHLMDVCWSKDAPSRSNWPSHRVQPSHRRLNLHRVTIEYT